MRYIRFLGLLMFSLNFTKSSVFSIIPEYVPTHDGVSKIEGIDRTWGEGSYLGQHFLDKIPKDQIHSILEIGSRDAVDSIRLSEYYKKHVFCFECNPLVLDQCSQMIGSNKNITLVPMAAWNETTVIPFYPVPVGNVGASSCYKISSQGSHVGIKQDTVYVPAIRLDDWLATNGIDTIDLLCIDAQGATLPILEGFGDRIHDVKYIITEVIYKKIYEGDPLYPEIKQYLTAHGFTVFFENPAVEWNDVLFIRNDLLTTDTITDDTATEHIINQE